MKKPHRKGQRRPSENSVHSEPSKGKETSWGGVAGWYSNLLENESSTYQSDVILPNLIRILKPVEHDHILDLACGQGYFARTCATFGAQVTASDISDELIKEAKKIETTLINDTWKRHVDPLKGNAHHGHKVSSRGKIIYHASPAHRCAFLGPASVNKVMIILAIQNIENLNEVFAEVSRVIKSQGQFIIVMNHPMFRSVKRTGWGWDENLRRQYRRIDAYMSESKEKIDMTPGSSQKKIETVSFNRPLQVYIKTLVKHGFSIQGIEEWISHKESGPGPRKHEEDRVRKEIPMFMMLKCIKN